MAVSSFEKNFSNLINAGFPYMYVQSYEEDRVVQAISGVLKYDCPAPLCFILSLSHSGTTDADHAEFCLLEIPPKPNPLLEP